MILMDIIDDAWGVVSLMITNNLSVNQSYIKLLHSQIFIKKHCRSFVIHLRTAFQNIRNNWATQKTQNLEFKVPNSDKIVKADFKLVYKEKTETLLRR